MFSRRDLDELVTIEAAPAAAVYLPTHRAGREIRQDPIRLKNLLSAVAERLAASLRKPEIDALVAAAETLVGDDDFWRQQEQGLAIFLAPGFHRVRKLPIPVSEEAVVGDHFYRTPLLELLEDAGAFWLLTISAKHTRVYRASPWTFGEAPGINLPPGLSAAILGH
jgi:hypothetical protein